MLEEVEVVVEDRSDLKEDTNYYVCIQQAISKVGRGWLCGTNDLQRFYFFLFQSFSSLSRLKSDQTVIDHYQSRAMICELSLAAVDWSQFAEQIALFWEWFCDYEKKKRMENGEYRMSRSFYYA